MARPPLRGAFVGYGNVASNGHAPGWRARGDVSIVAAAEPVAQQCGAFESAFPGARCYQTLDELLASETLDFIDLCTPPSSHLAMIDRALAAGVHVLSEKPLAISALDASAIAAAAGRAERVVHTVHNWLAAPVCLKVSELIDAGEIGDVVSVRWDTLRTGPAVTVGADAAGNWRLDPRTAGGGILVDHGWHALYCVAHWAGTPAVAVTGRLEVRRFTELAVEDTATVEIEFAQGRTGRVHLTWAAEERANSVEVEGERGRIRIAGASVILDGPSGERRWNCPPALSEGSHHPDRFERVALEFTEAVAGRSRGNLDEAVLCARLIDLARASNAAGGARMALDGPDAVRRLEAVEH